MILQNRTDLARLIKAAAASRGLSLSALGDALGVSRQSFSRSVNRSDLGFSDLSRIASALGCVLRVEFVPREETRPNPSE